MAHDKLAILVRKLHQRTIEGRLEWEVTATSGVYQTSFANYSINISKQQSQERYAPEDAEDVRLSILNDEGAELESFLDVDLPDSEFEDSVGQSARAYRIMSETYDSARRYALGSEQAIDEILLDLEDAGDELPSPPF